MSNQSSLSEPAKLLLLSALLSKDHIISRNGGAFLKELILRRDPRLSALMQIFESTNDFNMGDGSFLEQIHDLILEEAQSFYEDLFSDTSLEVGKTLSKEERDRRNLTGEKSLIYGEVEFNSFYRVLRKLNPAPGLKFYDLGSGTGKAVFVARLTQDFSKCVGIEILSSLHGQAAKVVKRFNSDFKQFLSLSVPQDAAVYEGSFLDFDWSDGDVVFANSTCFDDELMMDMSKKAEKLKAGALIVTFTKGLSIPVLDKTSAIQDRRQAQYKFELLERKRYRMSWGPATVFIHRRLSDDGTFLPPYRLNILPSDAITYDEDTTRSSFSSVDTNPPPASQATAKAANSPIVPVTKQTSPQYSASKYDYIDEEEEDDGDDDDDGEEEDDEDQDDDDDEDEEDDEEDGDDEAEEDTEDQAVESVPLEENEPPRAKGGYYVPKIYDDEDIKPSYREAGTSADGVKVEDVEDVDDDDEAFEDLQDLLPVSRSVNGSSTASNIASPTRPQHSPGKSSSVSSPASNTFFSPTRSTPQQKISTATRTPGNQAIPLSGTGSTMMSSAFASPSSSKLSGRSPMSPSLQLPLQEADFSFASLTSPQDSDLLRRKRAAPKRSLPIPPVILRRGEDEDDDDDDAEDGDDNYE